MRQVRYSAAMSLDGFIAGPKGEYDWIPMDPDIDFQALFERYDTVLMGRKSYEVARRHGEGGMPDKPAYVFSRTLRPEDCPGVIVSDNPKQTVSELKGRPGKDIWLFGGGELFAALLECGLVDGVEVAVIPILLGGGIPFLPQPAVRTKLKLLKHRVYEKTGTILMEYAI